jgi:hypothetical protein
VLFYDLKVDENRRRGGALLAIAAKSNILLYETPKGERAFRFVKVVTIRMLLRNISDCSQDFYTPLTPRSITFIEQTVQDVISRSMSNASTISSRSTGSRAPLMASGHERHSSDALARPPADAYGPQPSLFVVFEKKAGLIRIADSAVGEVELYDDGSGSLARLTPSASLSSLARRSRASYDGHGHGPFGFGKEQKGVWLPPVHIELPGSPLYHHASALSAATPVYCLTRGKQTHIVRAPLPSSLSAQPPLTVLSWNSMPSYVSPRILEGPAPDGETQPWLQLVAFGEDGVEVQELTLSFLATARTGNGKGKSKADEIVRADSDAGGDVGFLCVGGHWQRPAMQLSRTFSTASGASHTSFDSLDSEAVVDKLSKEQGIYGWVRKGYDDYRVFWVGGTGEETLEDTDDDQG